MCSRVRVSIVVAHGLSNCGAQAWLLHSVWDLPGPGIESGSLALAGEFLPLSHKGSPEAQALYVSMQKELSERQSDR